MSLIEPDELARYAEILRAHSWRTTDFELHESDVTDPVSDELLPIMGYVDVRCKSTNRRTEYPTGDGSDWLRAFERDLFAGRFL